MGELQFAGKKLIVASIALEIVKNIKKEGAFSRSGVDYPFINFELSR